MTEYLLSVHHDYDQQLPSDEDMQKAYADVDKFNAKLQEQGAWVFAGGLEAPGTATVVNGTGADVVITDGPFAEAKEHLGGFWVIQAADLDAALKWAGEASAACASPVEVRPFQGEG